MKTSFWIRSWWSRDTLIDTALQNNTSLILERTVTFCFKPGYVSFKNEESLSKYFDIKLSLCTLAPIRCHLSSGIKVKFQINSLLTCDSDIGLACAMWDGKDENLPGTLAHLLSVCVWKHCIVGGRWGRVADTARRVHSPPCPAVGRLQAEPPGGRWKHSLCPVLDPWPHFPDSTGQDYGPHGPVQLF